jgi:DNA-binding transcriptional regulator YdaS (Cro superfamily)
MEPISGGGVSVKSLFQLLALVGINQAQVAQLLHVPRPNVNLWARGHKAMPRKHLEAIERFTWEAVAQKNDAYLDAMVHALGDELGRYVRLEVSDAHPYLFPAPPPDAPPVVQQWWDFHIRALQLMEAWEVELHHERHEATVEALIRQIVKVAVDGGDKLRAMIEGPDPQLVDWFAQGHELLQALKRLKDARPVATRLRSALTRPRGIAVGARA